MTSLVGIDIHGDRASLALVTTDLGRPVVEELVQLPLKDLPGIALLNGAKVTLGVSDQEVLVKNLKLSLPDIISSTEAGSFELARSLLEPASDFIFLIRPTALPEEFIGLTLRLAKLSSLIDSLGFAPTTGLSIESFQVRSLALSKAFATYCQPEPGELIGLVDLAPPAAAIVLKYKGEPISLSSMPLNRADLADESSIRQLAVQTKTLINFQISRLAADGLNVPLATLLISGQQSDDRLLAILGEQFPAGVRQPMVNPAFLSSSNEETSSVLPFLVPMGLAVN